MLSAEKTKKLNKQEKIQMDKLIKEYDESAEATRTRRLNGPKEDVVKRYHQATKNLAEFLSKHNLTR
ncbi:hypothetical protein [Bacillus suaedae]|uniref:Uncharacterized protein n=1 Tax=Halalkalibacter suaedae TaxID=2822140 RepID=A0A940WXL9_9BACI|nr:hypothetical protein [Bacillus suaedae]MBP3953618.1 hypothetical protein [Bacillus suaedae]